MISDEDGHLATLSGQAKLVVKDVKKGAKKLIENVKEKAGRLLG